MSNQITLHAEPRSDLGKGASGRLRRTGRVPAVMYGYEVEPTSLSIDALELYHALHTEAGTNVLIRLEMGGDTHLTVARDLQRHPVRGETLHVDFIAVDRNVSIQVEVPVHLVGDDDLAPDNGVLNQVLYTVPIMVKPLDTPNYLELDVTGMAIGDVRRVEDLAAALPEGAEFVVDGDETVVTINAPISESALEAMEEAAGVEQDAPDAVTETDGQADAADEGSGA